MPESPPAVLIQSFDPPFAAYDSRHSSSATSPSSWSETLLDESSVSPLSMGLFAHKNPSHGKAPSSFLEREKYEFGLDLSGGGRE